MSFWCRVRGHDYNFYVNWIDRIGSVWCGRCRETVVALGENANAGWVRRAKAGKFPTLDCK